ncbi:zinc ribbon domain-containing protein [Chloroflexota bacterium]
MGVTKQLYQLQELDLEIESNEQTLRQKVSQLGESQTIIRTQTKLTSEQQRLDELRHQQHSAEWEIDDLVGKITTAEEQLYSGRISNPKELSNLQHETDILKTKRIHMEDKALEIMNQVELTEAIVAATSNELKKLESECQSQQQQLSVDIDQLKNKLSVLTEKRQLQAGEIDPEAVQLYEKLRQQKRHGMAKVEQGICRSCQISLPFSKLQQARSDNLVQCGSCGRILFLP